MLEKKVTEVIQLVGLQTQTAAMAMGLGLSRESYLQETADTWDALSKTVADVTVMDTAFAAVKKGQS